MSYPEFSADSIQRMLVFLPAFERGEFCTAMDFYLQNGHNPMLVDQLAVEVHRSGFVYPFDWPHWNEGREMNLSGVATADLLTIRKLMTAFVRSDRFCGGALPGRCTDGWIEQILRRLQVLAKGT